jgi:hypothetical protein
MERRGCNLGCIIAGLGLLLSCFLLPYLVSSIYSIITALLEVPGRVPWLWGYWLGDLVGESGALYMVLAEGPICCVGSIGLLTIVLGLVMMISGRRPREGSHAEAEAELYEEYDTEAEYAALEDDTDYEGPDEYWS